jgi:hypothetical protein
MAPESASDREDVEQLGQRFSELRNTHPVRSRLPEELWAAAAKLARRDGIEATALALDVDRPSLQKWTDRFEPGVQRLSVRFNSEFFLEVVEERDAGVVRIGAAQLAPPRSISASHRRSRSVRSYPPLDG